MNDDMHQYYDSRFLLFQYNRVPQTDFKLILVFVEFLAEKAEKPTSTLVP